MIITSHVGAGALMGLATRHPVPAFVLGFASHLGMDAIPHWGMGPGGDWIPIAQRDGVAGLATMGLLAAAAPRGRKLSVAAGMIGACLPDTDKLGLYFVGHNPWPDTFQRFHVRIQSEAPHRLRQEVVTAACLGLAAATLLRFAGRRGPVVEPYPFDQRAPASRGRVGVRTLRR